MIKKIVAIFIILFTMVTMSNGIYAETDQDYEIDGYVVTYKGVDYDLSTYEGNYNLTLNNPELSVEKYCEIVGLLDEMISQQTVLIGNNEDHVNDIIPDGPPGGYTYFNSMSWINRDDGINLSLNPKSTTRATYANAMNGWNEVVAYRSDDSNWYNAASLKGQYQCHFWFANTKTYWNISPDIPNKNAFQWVVDHCN